MKRLVLLFLLPLVAWSQSAPLTVFNTVADLLAYTPPVGVNPIRRVVALRGYNSIGDGGEGQFYYEDPCAENTNYGTIFPLPTYDGAGPVWRRATTASEPINMKWFGAKGDGVTDDTAAFRAAAASMTSGSTLVVPQGSYLIANATQPAIGLTNLSNITIQMDGEMIHKDYSYSDTATWKTIDSLSWSGGVATVHTTTAHGFIAGNSVTIAESSGPYLGKRTVVGTPDGQTFTFDLTDDPGADTDSGYVAKESFNRYFIKLVNCSDIDVKARLRNNTPLSIYNQLDVGYCGLWTKDCQNVKGSVVAEGLAYATTIISGSIPDGVTYFPTRDVNISIYANKCGYGLNGQWIDGGIVNLFAKTIHRGSFLAAPKNLTVNATLTDFETSGITLVVPTVPGVTEAQSIENVTINADCSGYTFDDERYAAEDTGPPLVGYSGYSGAGTGTNVYIKNLTVNSRLTVDDNTPCGIMPFYMDFSNGYYIINGLTANVEHDRSQQAWSGDLDRYTCFLRSLSGSARNVSVSYKGTLVSGSPSRGLYVNMTTLADGLMLYSTDPNKESMTVNTDVIRLYERPSVLDSTAAGILCPGGTGYNGISAPITEIGTGDYFFWTVIDTGTLSGTEKAFASISPDTNSMAAPTHWWDVRNGTIRAISRDSGANYGRADFTPSLSANTKYVVMVGRSGTNAVCWVNGSEYTATYGVYSGSPAADCFGVNLTSTRVSTFAANPWNGAIHQFALFAQTPTGEIANRLFKSGPVLSDIVNMRLWWRLDIGAGTEFPDISDHSADAITVGTGVTHLVPNEIWFLKDSVGGLVLDAVTYESTTGSGKSAIYAVDDGTTTTLVAKFADGTTNNLRTVTGGGTLYGAGTNIVYDVVGGYTNINVSTYWPELTVTNFTIVNGIGTLVVTNLTLVNPLTLANGGLNNALSDPGADRIMMWDESAGSGGQTAWMTPSADFVVSGTGLSIAGIYQPTNAILTTFAGLGTTTGDIIYHDATRWTNAAPGSTSGVQPYDAELAVWATLPTNSVTALTITTATTATDNIATLNLGTGTVTNNIFAKIGSGATVADMNLASASDSISGAIAFTHATNGAASTHKSHVHFLPNWSGGNQTLTIPAGWKTNVYSSVPANLTNGTITVMYVTSFAATDDAANQTNVTVSFEYYK